MTRISKSPNRHTFQKEGYIKRREEKGEPVDDEYLDMFSKILEQEDRKFDDLESRKNNLEYDLLTTNWILEKARLSESYAQNLYAALCNREFIKLEVLPILKDQKWGCSWRYAGGIIANMRQEGDYIDWYCSGIRNDDYQEDFNLAYPNGYVPEGLVTEEIRMDLQKLGWHVIDTD